MKKRIFCAGMASLLLALSSCSDTTMSNSTTKLTPSSSDSTSADNDLSDYDNSNGSVQLKSDEGEDSLIITAESDYSSMNDFAVNLFTTAYKSGENNLISPLSVIYALGMTSLGAEENTLTQMEEVFGMDKYTLLSTLKGIESAINSSEYGKVSLADSIWFKNSPDFTVNDDFISACSGSYNAEIYSSAFDENTVSDINKWVKENTDGMIDRILEEIPEEAVMYLINALTFDCEWQVQYNSTDVWTKDFHNSDESTSKVEFMSSDESRYLQGDSFTGFIKYYKNRDYGFAAFLPNEDASISDVISSFDGEALCNYLSNDDYEFVEVKIPKFSFDYSANISETLKKMGIVDAFTPDDANLSGIGESVYGNLYISRVLHKTHIDVAEDGTKAGAVTAVEVVAESAMDIEEPKKVVLDRPFVFVIFENTNKTPLFIGTYENAEG